MFTINEKLGRIKGLNVSIVGDISNSRVARSNIWGLTKLGANVTVCGPSTMIPFGIEKLFTWVVLAGIISFLTPVFWNISTAMVIDSTPNLRVGIPGRELALATGRLIGISFVLISFLYEKKPFIIFIFLGIVMLIYPLILFYRTKISKKYSYL